MITQLRVDNYRGVQRLELGLNSMNLLTGGNGSGKTSVLMAIAAIRDLATGRHAVAEAFPSLSCTRWVSEPHQTFRLALEGDDPCNQGAPITYLYELTIDHEHSGGKPTGRARVLRESVRAEGDRPLFEFSEGTVQLYNDGFGTGPQFTFNWERSGLSSVQLGRPDNTRLTHMVEMLRLIRVLHLSPEDVSDVSEQPEEQLAFSGGNFAAWYRWLSDGNQALGAEIGRALEEVIPGFDYFGAPEVGAGRKRLYVYRRHGAHQSQYDLSELSSGQLALTVLYTVLIDASKRGGVVCIDEPGAFLALEEIQPWLRDLSDLCLEGKAQAILTSHHPELVNYLGPEFGIWLRRGDEGGTDHEPLAGLLEDTLDPAEALSRGWVS
ncbi:MAG: AAA family ATPase [Acidobacteriota bacterium]|nr:AAA family ATPase [Acidobacteriota bacterium]